MLTLFLEGPLWVQILIGAALMSLLLFIVLLLAIPLGKLLNRGRSVEENQEFSEKDYLQGVLHSDLERDKTGEVLLKGVFGGHDVKPCRFYSREDAYLPKGTQVVVITITEGIAYVIKQTTLF
ncbi:hypothetical protein QR692_10285 [Lactococcus petauri]|uniref:hypothetical protein n=1 Tax=Lactococcus petauri TaxID=1940789 RepID=UPI00207914F3|nr:hypothetical protein [Lactococcus petauri]USI65371.1 hypothetical protein LMK05_11170 [Lactococcus petauri]USI67866.1 hypothetical protein LMK04_10405 [Lactococcus petauri]WJE12527.1 hypothetical protein QR692_10285 [Lactococcus petauri]